ncbi:MAG TPA: Dyp-type peroxidase [Mycobacteriales bacterium]|nr:Dyp-type peroxidase [Mycobacteriales bacterium]
MSGGRQAGAKPDSGTPGGRVSRRAFLGGTAAVGVTAVGTAAVVTGSGGPATTTVASSQPAFRGAHQAGILAAPAKAGTLVAFRCVDTDRAALAATLRGLSEEIEGLMDHREPAELPGSAPPADNSVLAGVADPWVSATVSVGASLFDDRYGLSGVKPRELVTMPPLANDRLDPARTHGDLLLVLHADYPDVCLHALRRIMRRTRSGLVLHWLLDGFNRPDVSPRPGQTKTRNLLGFKDGTGNPDAGQPALMDELVWVGPHDVGPRAGGAGGEPAWAVGGSYQAVRVIRMFVEQWDRAPLSEQEAIIGRAKGSGAPLDGRAETDAPAFAADPKGAKTPLDAHIRLANPRDASMAGRFILRRGFSFSRGFDGAGLLDQGLAFVSYQRRLAHFLDTQRRLAGEPLEEYIEPRGGGFFYALPGVPAGGGWLGQSLLES